MASVVMLLPMTVGFVASASSACEDATDALEAEAEASGYTFTPAVALALKNAVEACPGTESTTTSASSLLPSASGPTRPTPVEAHVKIDRGVAGSACGYADVKMGHHDDAPLTAYRMVVFYTETTNENGPADVTYNPATDVASYTVRGPTYGMTATGAAGVNNGASGSIFAYGVSIPAILSTVDAGCGVNNPDLCWGYGYAETFINSVGIAVISAFNHC